MNRIDVVSLGRMMLPGPEVFWMSAWEDWFDANFWMVVIRNTEHTMVINTGPPPDLTQLNALWKAWHPSGRSQFRRSGEDEPAAALARLGVDPARVTHVILTPIIAYTCGNLDLFPNSRILFSRRGWIDDVLAPPYHPHLPRDIFMPDPVLRHVLFEARERVQLLNDGDVVAPGVRVWESFVHHRGSLAIEVESSKGRVVITDSAFSYRNVSENIHLGIGESYSEAMATYERLRREADVLIPLYEPEVSKRHPDGIVAP